MVLKNAPFKAVVVYIVLLVAVVPSVLAQSRSDRQRSLTDLSEGGAQALQQRLSTSSVPLEGAVDPMTYMVGPGDLFHISVGGPEPALVTIPVTADGHMVLPGTGSVPVAGFTLAEARSRAIAALRTQFQRVNIEVALSQPRQFYVHVSGAVPLPGRFLATPVARVASVLSQVFADTSFTPVGNTSYRPSLRNVAVIRRDGSRLSLDLTRYLSTGDVRHNPYLQDGDVINVPPYDPNNDAVFISGAVAFPGTYDFRSGDTVGDLLALASGSESPSAPAVRLTRSAGGSVQTEILEGQTNLLQPRDHLFVIPEQRNGGIASAEGFVQYPGSYPIEPGVTTLQELVARSGGLRPEALARGAYLERRILPEPAPVDRTHRFEPAPHVSKLFRPDTTTALRGVRLAEFDLLGRAYFAQEMRLQNRVSVDLTTALADGEPIVLQDGDRLVVPRDDRTVLVLGQVSRPGYVTHHAGMTATDYIAAAGGRSPLAAEAFVVEAGTGRYLPVAEAQVESGDVIFVNRRADMADTAELQRLVFEERRMEMEEQRARAESRFRIAQTVLQTVGIAASFITTYLLISRQQ